MLLVWCLLVGISQIWNDKLNDELTLSQTSPGFYVSAVKILDSSNLREFRDDNFEIDDMEESSPNG